ncbi:MAG: FAD-dependent oxidoreductase [Planctomycetes bacterium]|nr:FAD-dependent oxidoreductase [Planctomycetota bacterium]
MRIAIVGTGIAGMVAARKLHRDHDITVFEAEDRIGGHTNTVDVSTESGSLAVDTGFIVFNQKTYPNFCALLRELKVEWQETEMSFSVRCDRTGLEYNGTSLNGLLAQRLNAFKPSFWRMVRDIMRFYREAPAVLERDDADLTLGDFLDRGRYSREFVEQHMLPMGAAVWSARLENMRTFPLRFLVQFFHNHGFLQVEDRPQWLTVRGGSREYARALVAPFEDRIRLRTPIASVRRAADGVVLRTQGGQADSFDRVVLATHADTSLRLLTDASPLEREILGAFGFQRNEALLHTDTSIMPKQKRAWASWNYHVTNPTTDLPTVTYWMNRLQSIEGDRQYLVTLNRSDSIDPAQVLRRFVYHHPIFTRDSVRAQTRHGEIDGVAGVHFCGAYWGYGFHEDGVKSALAVLERMRVEVAA